MRSKTVSTKLNLEDRSARANACIGLHCSLGEVKHPLKEGLRPNDGYTPPPYRLADIPVAIAVTSEEMAKQGVRNTGDLPNSQALPLPYAMGQKISNKSLAVQAQPSIGVSPVGSNRSIAFNGLAEKLKVGNVFDRQVNGQGVSRNASICCDKSEPVGLLLGSDVVKEALVEFPASTGFCIAASSDRVTSERVKNCLPVDAKRHRKGVRVHSFLIQKANLVLFFWRQSLLAIRIIPASNAPAPKRMNDGSWVAAKFMCDFIRAQALLHVEFLRLQVLSFSQLHPVSHWNAEPMQGSINGRPRDAKTDGYSLTTEALMLVKVGHHVLLFLRQRPHVFMMAHSNQ